MFRAQHRHNGLRQIALRAPWVEETTIRMVLIRRGMLCQHHRDNLRRGVVRVSSPRIGYPVLLHWVELVCLLELRMHLKGGCMYIAEFGRRRKGTRPKLTGQLRDLTGRGQAVEVGAVGGDEPAHVPPWP